LSSGGRQHSFRFNNHQQQSTRGVTDETFSGCIDRFHVSFLGGFRSRRHEGRESKVRKNREGRGKRRKDEGRKGREVQGRKSQREARQQDVSSPTALARVRCPPRFACASFYVYFL